MAIVPPPTGDPDAPLGVLTGSEDGTVLRAVYTRERVARSPGEVGQHFAGAGVRAMRVVPERPGGGLGGAVPGVEDAPSSPPASYLLITAGAKEVIQAWRVRWSRSAAPAPGERSGAWELRATLAAARGGDAKPGHAEWTKGCGGLRASVASDQRYMDVTAYVPAMKEPRPSLRGSAASSDSERTGSNRADSSAACVVLAASSDGSVAAFALLESGGGGGGGGGGGDAARRRGRARGGAAHRGGWRLAATLRHHTRPALSVAVLGVALDRGPRGSLATVAFTGATDGELAAWDLTALEDHLGPGPEPDGLGGDANARAAAPSLAPVALFPRAHQSGVNGIALAPPPPGAAAAGRALVASVGDDQAVRVALVAVHAATGPRERGGGARAAATLPGSGGSPPVSGASPPLGSLGVSELGVRVVAFAHSAAVKGVWLDPRGGGTLATTSHDQRLRVWRVAVEVIGVGAGAGPRPGGDRDLGVPRVAVEVRGVAGSFAECPEPEGLDAFAGDDGRVSVAVSGRGVQMFHAE